MADEKWQKVREIFDAALRQKQEERNAFLESVCDGDNDLRREVESLLSSLKSADEFLEQPAIGQVANIVINDGPSLITRQAIGPYRIIKQIGKGGMGEVYSAEDTRLNREVAIKVLPAKIANDVKRLQRFEQEARATSSLNHPNILTVYDFGAYEAAPFIVTELLRGEELRDYLNKRTPPIRKTVEYAEQIVSGLVAAHEKGIAHRDLKPENLFITTDDRVKILDFGIAKLRHPKTRRRSSEDPIRQAVTDDGTIMGTVGYMSPEQVRGDFTDYRSDIFSFGAILYEMLAGRRAFHKETAAETMVAILNEEPEELNELDPTINKSLERIVHRCLAKKAEQRFQSTADLGFALNALSLQSGRHRSLEPDTPTTLAHRKRPMFLFAVGTLLIATSVVAGWFLYKAGWFLPQPTAAKQNTANLESITLTAITNDPGYEGEPTFSPDGETIAYVSDRSGNFEIYIQQVSGGAYRNISEDKADDVQPAYSPDGKQIAFVSSRSSSSDLRWEGYDLPLMGGDIWVMPALGGSARRVAKDGNFPSWSPDSSAIIYTGGPAFGQNIYRVSALGGEPREIVPKRKAEAGIPRFLLYPSYSSDERWIVYEADSPTGFGPRDIWVMNTESGETEHIARGSNPSWNADSSAIVYSSAEPGKNFSLWQVPFSGALGKISGTAEPLTVSRGRDTKPAVSRDGSQIAFAGVEISFAVERLAFDAEAGKTSGMPAPITSGRQVSYFQSFSPDGQTVVFESRQGNGSQVWKSVRDSVPVQLTADPDLDDTFPRWSPTGRDIAFSRKQVKSSAQESSLWLMTDDGANPRMVIENAGFFAWMPDGRALIYFSWVDRQIYVFDLDANSARRLTDEPKIVHLFAVSADGKWVVFQTLQDGNIDLKTVPIEGGETRTVVATPHQDYHPSLSPSGRWLYFQPDHKNLYRVPGPAQGWRQAEPQKITNFSESSGMFFEDPQISNDGRQLLYSRGHVTGDIWMMRLREK
jgi:serine/threonine protein kinase